MARLQTISALLYFSEFFYPKRYHYHIFYQEIYFTSCISIYHFCKHIERFYRSLDQKLSPFSLKSSWIPGRRLQERKSFKIHGVVPTNLQSFSTFQWISRKVSPDILRSIPGASFTVIIILHPAKLADIQVFHQNPAEFFRIFPTCHRILSDILIETDQRLNQIEDHLQSLTFFPISSFHGWYQGVIHFPFFIINLIKNFKRGSL